MLTLASPLQAQSKPSRKSPGGAALMSFVLPGLGQFYTKQPGKGLLLMGTYAGCMGLVIAYGPWTWEEEKKGDPFFSDLAEGTATSGTTKAIWYGSAAVAGGVLIYAVIDAAKAARKYNEKQFGILPYFKGDAVGVQLSFRPGF
jgi:TM2 domain-containing membrane protein YozV